ncbi:SEC-C domain-containing protein [Pseudomonas sp. PDM28]|uniref:SEC-C domain-containing protein n=1 Tax=Pseudomonas sp. PDM28 TaxID=2854770 RepID=UPI001C47A13A|nr:SEC-C domain-containing protein [Pseudomonas sp. PDM28]MBV7552251.1 SEC-C domain-containing protein [Pseudomonas sp. PDM28]
MDLGRNEPCWCGSKLKYKKCHLDRDKQPAVSLADAYKTLKKFNVSKTCSVPSALHSECTKKIINAHTVSKSSSLKEISVDGHVLSFYSSAMENIKAGKLSPNKIGINKASTFSGFCSHHDKTLFSPIEDNPFSVNSEHCFLVAYRAVSREVYVKNSASNVFQDIKSFDKGLPLNLQIAFQQFAGSAYNGNDLTKKDLAYIKGKLDMMFMEKTVSQLKHVVFELEKPPSVMGSAIVALKFGFDGKSIQSFSQNAQDIPDYIIINFFSSAEKGYIVLSWLQEHATTAQKLIKQIAENNITSDYLAILMISFIENIYIDPAWWDTLESKLQNYVCDVFSGGVTRQYTGNSMVNVPALNIAKITSVDKSLMT